MCSSQPACTRRMYKPPASLLSRIAPTEVDPRRGGLVRGKVHDERAYYLGGVSAHAGIFSSAHDLARFAQMYLNDGVIDGTRVLPRADQTVHRVRRFDLLESRHWLAEARSPRHEIHDAVGGMGWPLDVDAGVRAYRIHRHVDRDRSTERHLHHPAQQSRQSHSREQQDHRGAPAARRRRDVARSFIQHLTRP